MRAGHGVYSDPALVKFGERFNSYVAIPFGGQALSARSGLGYGRFIGNGEHTMTASAQVSHSYPGEDPVDSHHHGSRGVGSHRAIEDHGQRRNTAAQSDLHRCILRSSFHDDTEALCEAGDNAGCSTNLLMNCPEVTMSRAEPSVFVERGIHAAPLVSARAGLPVLC